MFAKIAYFEILNMPVVAYLGIVGYFCLLFTFTIAILTHRGVRKIPFRWHPRMAYITVIISTLHALLIFLASL